MRAADETGSTPTAGGATEARGGVGQDVAVKGGSPPASRPNSSGADSADRDDLGGFTTRPAVQESGLT